MRKQHLYDVFVALIESNEKAAKEAFLDYLVELSKKTLGSYVKKSSTDLAVNTALATVGNDSERRKKKIERRFKGIDNAADKLSKEKE